jgi:hypothetical protein
MRLVISEAPAHLIHCLLICLISGIECVVTGQDQGQLHQREDAGVLQEGHAQRGTDGAWNRQKPALRGTTGAVLWCSEQVVVDS